MTEPNATPSDEFRDTDQHDDDDEVLVMTTPPDHKKNGKSDDDTTPSTTQGSPMAKVDVEDGRKLFGEDDGSEDEPPPSRMQPQKRCVLMSACIFALIAGLVTVVAILVRTHRTSGDGDDLAVEAQTPRDDIFVPVTPVALTPVAPVAAPVVAPVAAPVASPTTPPSPTNPPVPTPAPTVDLITPLVTFLETQGVDTTPTVAQQAVAWLVDEAPTSLDDALLQRFAVVATQLSLQGSTTRRRLEALPSVPTCQWPGVECDVNGTVTALKWGSQEYTGVIPQEIGLLSGLESLDLSQNQIGGEIPDTLYDIASLHTLYLYQNELGGSLSSKIGQLQQLQYLHLSHNRLTGSIPMEMRSQGDAMRLYKYVNLYKNQLSGSIPTGLRWRNVFLLDLGFNQLTGPIPDEFHRFADLRHLRLDHNRLTGTVPSSTVLAGGGRIVTLRLDHNELRGNVPADFVDFDMLVAYTLHENKFDQVGKKTCNLSVFVQGEMVEYNADCDVCQCKDLCNQHC